MYEELDKKDFDFVVFGSGVSESLISSHITRCGKKLLQFDISKFYGADCKNFNLRDLEECKKKFKI
jgi:RAB protein geranylgeranyltransferase component A